MSILCSRIRRNAVKALNVIRDERIAATSILLEMTFREYLRLVSGAEENLDIQRKIVRGFKPYERLRQDLKLGCLIPAPTLAIQNGGLPPIVDFEIFTAALNQLAPAHVYIVDGLQRTNAIRQVVQSYEDDTEREGFLDRPLRVEVWPDIPLKALTYRMILLNAGQKPMSLKHQLEVVSSALCDHLKEELHGEIEIYREREADRRSGPGQYRFALIASAFQAFVQKAPHIDLRNEVISELNQTDALESYGKSMGPESSDDPSTAFVEYIRFLVALDRGVCRVYPEKRVDDHGDVLPSGITLFSRDTFQLALAAAYSWCNEYKPTALNLSKERLLVLLNDAVPNESDPLAIGRLERIQTGFKRKDNVGEQTRTLIFAGFKEFFRSEGLTPFSEAWTQA